MLNGCSRPRLLLQISFILTILYVVTLQSILISVYQQPINVKLENGERVRGLRTDDEQVVRTPPQEDTIEILSWTRGRNQERRIYPDPIALNKHFQGGDETLYDDDYTYVLEQEATRNNGSREPPGPFVTREQLMLQHDKQTILEPFLKSNISITHETLRQLPTQAHINNLFGNTTVIVGLDQCSRFREQVPPEHRLIAPTGMINSGTHLLWKLLEDNCNLETIWQVPWGKHRPLAGRNHTVPHMAEYEKQHVLPVAIIKDPFYWMQSLCRHPYAAVWLHRRHLHCPNLIPTLQELKRFPVLGKFRNGIPIRMGADSWFPSMIHWYSWWYRQYLDNKPGMPRLMIRYEDLLFQTQHVVEQVCQCAGGSIITNQDFSYITDSAKETQQEAHKGETTDISTAMIRYGTTEARFRNMTRDDLKFVEENVDPYLTQTFRYQIGSTESLS